MGINQAFSSWLRGAQSSATAALRSAQAYGATLQQQTMTALAGAQRAATQPFQQVLQPRPSSRSPAPYTARTITPAAAVSRAVSGGAQAAQRAAAPIIRAHAPIVQGIQRDAGRATQAIPKAVANAPAAIQSGARQFVQAHAPIVQGIQRDASAVVRSVGGAGRARVDPRVASPPPTLGGQTSGRSPTPTPASSARLTPQQRYDRYAQDAQRYQNNPAHTRLPQLIAQHEQKVKQYGIDPQLRQYEQKLSAYNAQLEAHQRAIARGQGRQETANRLQLMRQELEGTRTSIESRKRQERAEIQMLEANIRMMGAPLQAEYQRLRVEEMALRPILATRGPTRPSAVQQGASQFAAAHAPIIQGLQRDMGRVMGAVPAPLRDAAAFATQKKRDAQAELTRVAGPAATFEQGWTYPIYKLGQDVNMGYQGFVDQALPLYRRVQPLPNLPGVHSLQRGFARAPGSLLESLTFLPPAAERAGQLLWKEPHKLPGTAAKFAGQQIEGMGAAYERDPYDFAGEMIGTVALSYGLGAVARGSGTPKPRAAAGGTGSPGGAGGRFRALEFGFQTKLVRKPPTSQKPFSLAEWQKERQKYSRGRPVDQVQQVPARVQAPTQPRADTARGGVSRQTPPPDGGQSRLIYGLPPLLGGASAPATTPAIPMVMPLGIVAPGPQQRSGRGSKTDLALPGVGLPSRLTQDFASREAEMVALVLAPPAINMAQPVVTSTVLRAGTETKAQTSPPRKGPGVLAGPPYLLPPRTTARGKDKKKKEEEERRRLREAQERAHWELGPAPGIEEMSSMIFGAAPNPGGQPSFGFAARGPARPPVIPSFGPPSRGVTGGSSTPGKKPAHAGEMRKKRGKAREKKK